MQAQLEPLGGALQLTELRNLLDVVLEQAVSGLRELAAQLPSKADDARKQELLAYLHATRQRLLRLHVLAQWGNMAPAAAAVSRVLDAAARQGDAARDAADQLAMSHAHITAVQAPIHDVPTAAEVLETGGYRSLPAAIEQLRPALPPPAAERAAALRLMDQMLRARLLQEALPAGLQVLRVRAGVAVLGTPALFEARLTLVPAPDEHAVLARCGASSAPASSPAPSSAATLPAAVDAVAPADDQTAVKAEAGPEVQAQPAAAGAAPQQAAEAAAQPAVGGTAAAAAASGAEPSSEQLPQPRRYEEWRWRLLSFTVLPSFKGRTAVGAQSAAALQGQLEARMWAAADAAVLAAAGGVRIASASQSAASGQHSNPQRQRSSTPPAAAVKAEPETLAASQVGAPRATPEPTGSGPKGGDELPTPLGLMAAVLKGVATRILVQEAVASLRKLAGPAGAWHGSLRITEPRHLSIGARAEYWTGSPPAVSAAQLATQPAATVAPAAQAGPALAGGAPATKLEAGVAIEIGLDAAGDIRIVADPPLASPSPADAAAAAPAPHLAAEPALATAIERPAETSAEPDGASHASADRVALNVDRGGAISPAAVDVSGLWLDPATGDAGAPLLAAARATAALQLGALQRALRRASSLAGAGGAAVLQADDGPAEDAAEQDAAVPGAEPGHTAGAALELRCGDATVLTVGVAPRTGRLTLRFGGGAAAESAYDQGAFTSQEEDRLARQQREAAVRAAASSDADAQHPAAAAVDAAAARLAGLFAALETRRRLQILVAAARRLGLRESSLPRPLLKAYTDSHSGAVTLPQRFAVLAFPPTPPLAGFAHNRQLPTSKGSNSSSSSGSSWSLRFCFLAAPAQRPERGRTSSPAAAGEAAGAAAAVAGGWRFWLAAVRTSLHGVPQRVLQLQDVPLQPAVAASPPMPPGTAAAPAPSAVQPAADAVAAAAAAAEPQPEPASGLPSKRKRQREAAADGGLEADVRPHKQLREAGANGLMPGGGVANGLSAGSDTTCSSVHATNGAAAVTTPALLGNGHVSHPAPAAAPGVKLIAANGAASEPAAMAPAVPVATSAGAAAAAVPPAAGLEHAVAWCRGRLTWTSLVLQLQALGLPFVEQLTLGPPGGSATEGAAATSQHAPRQPVRSLRLTGLRATAALNAAAAAAPLGAAAAAEQPGLVLLPGSGSPKPSGGRLPDSSFRAVLCSAYLAGLPLQGGSAQAGEAGTTAAAAVPAIVPVEGGVSIANSLSAGDTALTAVHDALRIARLHTFLQRLHRLTAPHQASSASAAAGPADAAAHAGGAASSFSFQLPRCGAVQLLQASPLQAVLAVRPATDGGTATGAAAAATGTGPELRVTIQWLPPGPPSAPERAAQQAPGSGGPAAVQAASPAAGQMCCNVSASVVAPGAAEADTAAAEATMAAAAAAADAAAAGAADTTSAVVPEAWCAALAAMADAGEEALLLRALAVAGPQLAATAAAASPAALAAAGWRVGQATLQCPRPPYSAQLRLRKAEGSACSIDLRFAAGQLTWLSVSLAAATTLSAAATAEAKTLLPKQEGGQPTEAAAAGTPALPGDMGLAQLLADLAQQHAAVSLPAEPRATAIAGTSADAAQMQGVWVHGGTSLQAVISAVVTHLAQHLPY